MLDINSLLLILQSCSLTVTVVLALLLFFAWFHQPDTSREYEEMRWYIVAALLLLTVHYFLQIHFGFRAQGADVGALVNTLFYPPAIYVFSYSFTRLASRKSFQRRFILVAFVSMLVIVGCFIGGFLYYGSLHMPVALSAMGACFFASILFCFLYPLKEIRRMQRLADEESGQMQVQFNLFLRTSSTLLYVASLVMSISIYFTPLLFIVGILNLTAMLFFVVSFIALGFNINGLSQIISTEMEEPASPNGIASDESKPAISPEQRDMVSSLLDTWRQNQGFATSDLNSTILALRLNIPKRLLVQYLREVEGKTFRVWLSDLRLEEAKNMILKNPDYSNETIAEACGFSRSHLQVKFKDSTGLTPNDWRDAHAQQERQK